MADKEEHIGFLLKRIHDGMERDANENLKPHGVTFSQMRTLSYLIRRGDAPTTQKDIEDHFSISHPTVVGLVKRLEGKGLIECAFDPENGRAKLVRLTDEGRAFMHKTRKDRARMEQILTKDFKPEEIDQLRTLLKKVLSNVSSN